MRSDTEKFIATLIMVVGYLVVIWFWEGRQ
jgi:hypothetical protein